jgi:uncharacterized membrane protein YqhA
MKASLAGPGTRPSPHAAGPGAAGRGEAGCLVRPDMGILGTMESQPEDPAAGPEPGPEAEPGRGQSFLTATERTLAMSLGLALIPVVVLLVAALAAFVYGTAVFVYLCKSVIGHPFPVGHQVGLFLLDVDLFLIGATLLISAIGFYELFIRHIRPHGALRVPAWLEMSDLNDLKRRVIAMVVLVIAVSFAELAVDEPNGLELLEVGGGVTAVIIALAVFLRLTVPLDNHD